MAIHLLLKLMIEEDVRDGLIAKLLERPQLTETTQSLGQERAGGPPLGLCADLARSLIAHDK